MCVCVCVWGGGGGASNGSNCGTTKPTPFIHLAFEKTDLFIYLNVQKLTYYRLPFVFIHLLLVVGQISQSVH